VSTQSITSNYILQVNKRKWINANHSSDIGGFANGVLSTNEIDNVQATMQSSCIIVVRKADIVSTKQIKTRQEICVPYGNAYWQAMSTI